MAKGQFLHAGVPVAFGSAVAFRRVTSCFLWVDFPTMGRWQGLLWGKVEQGKPRILLESKAWNAVPFWGPFILPITQLHSELWIDNKAYIFGLIIFAYVSLCCPCLRNWESPSILCASNFALCTGISSRGRGCRSRCLGHDTCDVSSKPKFSWANSCGMHSLPSKAQCTVTLSSPNSSAVRALARVQRLSESVHFPVVEQFYITNEYRCLIVVKSWWANTR